MTEIRLSMLKKTLVLFGFVLALAVASIGCDSGGEEESGDVTLQGQILDAGNNPVAEAVVRADPPGVITETDDQGRYTVTFEVDSTTTVRVQVTKNGFTTNSTQVLAIAGRVIDVPTLRITETIDSGPISGQASNILLGSQSAEIIGVKESGSPEVANIEFIVADSLGRPVTLENAVDVVFTLGQQPGGGEFISPQRVRTDNNGRAVVNLSSGTRAGVVQIVAQAQVGGVTIRSLPVSVAIHGGLPDQEHFSLGPVRFNFPGLRRFGLTNQIAVIVGDKYSNPVRPQTVVYFSTTHGVIEGSVATNAQGRGTVSLISANPLPPDGIAVVTARTADENQDSVRSQTPVVFSGIPVVTINPGVVQLGRTYNLTVTDQNGNPLVQGTSIRTQVEGTNVKCVGNCDVELDDTSFIGGIGYDNVVRGQGITEFRFAAVADIPAEANPDSVAPPVVEAITVNVSGDNGRLEVVLGGDVLPKARTRGTTMEVLPDGSVRFTAPKDDR